MSIVTGVTFEGPRLVRVLRERRGLTQSKLAQRVGRSQVEISLIESGNIRPPWEMLEKIAQVLEYEGDPEDLLAETEVRVK